MKKLLCALLCAALLPLGCAVAGEAGEFPTATAVKEYLPTVGWDDYTARDTDGDGFDDEIVISYNSNGVTPSDTIDVYCQCRDGSARVVCCMAEVPEGTDLAKVYEQANEFNHNLVNGRWIYDEDSRMFLYCQEVYEVSPDGFGAYVYNYMNTAASYVYSFYGRFTSAIA